MLRLVPADYLEGVEGQLITVLPILPPDSLPAERLVVLPAVDDNLVQVVIEGLFD